MEVFLLVAGAFGLIMLAMGVGVIFTDRPLRGSCGGPAVLDLEGNPMTCPDCNCDIDGNLGNEARPGSAEVT